MSEFLKPQSPLQHKDGAYIYPLTTADQVILENGNRLNAALNDMSSKPKAGFIYPLASSVVPDGFLLCDGAEYSRVQYEELFAAIGTIYGNGDGSTTFNVPNLQTRVPVGVGEGYGLGSVGGEATHTLTVDEMPSHTHKLLGESKSLASGTEYSRFSGTGSVEFSSIVNTGGSQPHNNMQPYTVVNYIIATGKDTGVSVSDIIMGAQAIPLEVQYGGTGATTLKDVRQNLGINARNLLDNSDFRNPVNQRGKTAYTGNVYTIDRWQVWQDTMTVGNGFVKANALFQFLQIPIDKVYTLVACAEDGSKAVVSGMPLNAVSALKDGVSVTLTNIAGYTEPIIGSEKNLIWAALYEGEYTAETLPEYQPKGYGAELLECQRYYEKTDLIYDANNMTVDKTFPYKVNKRIAQPTVTIYSDTGRAGYMSRYNPDTGGYEDVEVLFVEANVYGARIFSTNNGQFRFRMETSADL